MSPADGETNSPDKIATSNVTIQKQKL